MAQWREHSSPINVVRVRFWADATCGLSYGWGKVVYTTKSIRAAPIFLVRVLFSSEPCQNFSEV